MGGSMLYIVTCLLGMAVIALGSVTNRTVSKADLPIPRIYGISRDTAGTIIHWLPIDDTGDEPVLGYKVRLWEVGCITKLKYKTFNGETVAVKEQVLPRLRNYSTLRNLKELSQEGVKNSSFFMKNVQHSTDVPYLMRVSAYSASGEGQLSAPFRFQVMGRYKCT